MIQLSLGSKNHNNNFMNQINLDILERINAEYSDEDQKEILMIIENIFSNGSIVGPAQLARSLLFLANGNLNLIKQFMTKDPRDVILAAERKIGSPGHFFNLPFDEIDQFFEKLYGNE